MIHRRDHSIQIFRDVFIYPFHGQWDVLRGVRLRYMGVYAHTLAVNQVVNIPVVFTAFVN